MTTLEIRTDLLTRARIRSLERRVTRRNLDCLQVASARALSRVAAKARRDQIDHIDQEIEDPVDYTRNSPRFRGANKNQPIDQQRSAVFIARAQSRYLQPLLEGEQTEQYGRSILIQPVAILQNARRRGLLEISSLDKFGNVEGLRQRKIKEILAREDIFQVLLNDPNRSVRHLSPGIYWRIRRGRTGRRSTSLIVKIYEYVERHERESGFDFTGTGVKTFRRYVGQFYGEELRRCLRRRRL